MQDDLEKQDNGVLVPFEKWMARTGLRWVPQGMTANQLTLLSGVVGMLAGVAVWLASFHKGWFVVGALLVFLHWAADNVDGHVARTRNQCSAAGRFLDIFSDALCFAALGLGFAFASYSHFPIVAVATILCLLQYVLTVLWIALTRIWPFPAFGPAEASLTAIIISLLMIVLPRDLVVIGGRPLSLVDLAFALTIPGSLLVLATSGLALYRHLTEAESVPAGAGAVVAEAGGRT